MSEPFEIEVTKGSFSLRVKGFKPLAQIGQYAADAVGVIGEPLGLVKDKLHNYRLHREASAAAALARTIQILESEGKQLQKLSTKTLASWLEGASQEDLETDNILELWARLLAGTQDHSEGIVLSVTELLSAISPSEAKLMAEICTARLIEESFYWSPSLSTHNRNELINRVVNVFFGANGPEAGKLGVSKNITSFDFDLRLAHIDIVSVQYASESNEYLSYLPNETKDSAEVLCSHHLLERKHLWKQVDEPTKMIVEIYYYEATRLFLHVATLLKLGAAMAEENSSESDQ